MPRAHLLGPLPAGPGHGEQSERTGADHRDPLARPASASRSACHDTAAGFTIEASRTSKPAGSYQPGGGRVEVLGHALVGAYAEGAWSWVR